MLGIDPKNLSFEFKRDWQTFSESRVKKFLVAWLRKELENAMRALENVAPADLGKQQGIVIEIRRMLNLVQQPHYPDEAMREVIVFLER